MPTPDAATARPGSGIVFACIAPHGELAIPEACQPEDRDRAPATQAAMRELARRFEATDPDVVVVLTPHGIHVEGHLAVVVAGRASGVLEEAPDVALDVPIDRHLGLAIVRALTRAGIPALGVSYGGNLPAEAVMPLDWGSLIPLWYLGARRDPPTPTVIVAPARDLPLEAHVAAGEAIARAIATAGSRAAIVASADQAHAHAPDGPYGFDPAARVFDERLASILRPDGVREGTLGALRDLDPALIEAAKPDSPWQMLMLLGAIGESWRPELLSYEVPTYFGMLCAAFEPPRG